MTPAAVAPDEGTDEVLVALDALLAALRDSTRRNQAATRRAQTIRRLRSHGRSYGEILARVAGASILGITRDNVESLVAASDQLHRAEVVALAREGLTVPEITALTDC